MSQERRGVRAFSLEVLRRTAVDRQPAGCEDCSSNKGRERVRNAKSQFAEFAGSICRAGVSRYLQFPLAIALLALGSFFVAAQPAAAAEHEAITGEYGKEGAKETGLGNGCSLAFNEAAGHLYLLSDNKVYGFQWSGPGTLAPLSGTFPFATQNSSCGDRDLAVDNSGTATDGRIYVTPSSEEIHAYTPTGTPLGPPWPVSLGGETCGVAVDNEGGVWGGRYSSPSSAKRFSSAGALQKTVALPGSTCKLIVNNANNDLFTAEYSGPQTLRKWTAASGYTTSVNFPATGANDPGLAVNGAEGKIYVAAGTTVKAYDVESGALLETLTPGGTVWDVAVDEGTDTLWVSVGSGPTGYIVEYLGVKTPKATTGPVTGNEVVSGTADPNEVGPITECLFEYGASPSYGSKQDCAESVPFNAEQTVHATLPGLSSEQTYHYRLVLGTGVPFVVGKGHDLTITPHNVKGLKTEAPEDVTRSTATLRASFEGNGQDTHYYFEWGPTTAYGSTSATPPGPSAGSPTYPPTTPLSFTATGLHSETVYHYRVVAENGVGITQAEDRQFETPPAVQSLATGDADVAPGAATLHASYLGDGNDTTYYFEYVDYIDFDPAATDPYEAGRTTSEAPGADAGSGNGSQELSAVADHIEPYVEYHYRVVATNKYGTTYGEEQIFVSAPPMLPTVADTFSSNVTESGATLNAQVNPGLGPTVVRFEFGLGAQYGSRTPASEPIGSDALDHLASAPVASLEPGTTYHFRAVATNFAGTTHGPDETVTTASPPTPAVTPAAGPGTPTPVAQSNGAPTSRKGACTALGRSAKKDIRKARRLRHKAAGASGPRARKLRQRGAQLTKQATKLSAQAKTCRREAREGGR